MGCYHRRECRILDSVYKVIITKRPPPKGLFIVNHVDLEEPQPLLTKTADLCFNKAYDQQATQPATVKGLST
jgi:hypothetical protein